MQNATPFSRAAGGLAYFAVQAKRESDNSFSDPSNEQNSLSIAPPRNVPPPRIETSGPQGRPSSSYLNFVSNNPNECNLYDATLERAGTNSGPWEGVTDGEWILIGNNRRLYFSVPRANHDPAKRLYRIKYRYHSGAAGQYREVPSAPLDVR